MVRMSVCDEPMSHVAQINTGASGLGGCVRPGVDEDSIVDQQAAARAHSPLSPRILTCGTATESVRDSVCGSRP